MYQLSANLEWLFTEAAATPQRIHAAAAAGLAAVEIWTWRDKDLDGIEDALRNRLRLLGWTSCAKRTRLQRHQEAAEQRP